MKVVQAVAHAFMKEGASDVFGLMGDGNMTWWAAMSKYPGVTMIDGRDEGAALSMAEGWARVTGTPGVCNVTHGPGITRMATSLVAAAKARVPIVVYTSSTSFNNKTFNQFLEQERFVTSTGAGYIEVLNPQYAETAVQQAFFQAKTESRPIVLSVPMDLQDKECDSDGDDYQPSSTLFAGQQPIQPSAERLEAAIKLIKASKKPVVLVGQGAMLARAEDAAAKLAERIGALTATSLVAKGMLAGSGFHAGIAGLFSTRTAMQLFHEADCVIAIGASLNTHTIEGGYLFPDARIIHIDTAPHMVMGNGKVADCYIQGDARITVEALLARLEDAKFSEGFRTPDVRKALLNADRDPAEYEIEPGTVDPREAVRIIDERLPSEVSAAIGLGHCFAFPVMIMNKPRAKQIFVQGFGSIGQTLATAIGSAVALKGKPLAVFDGDGSMLQNIQELDTAARLKLNVLFIVLNDEALGAEYHKLKAKKIDPDLSVIRSPDFAAVAQAFGCRAATARTPEQVAAGIDAFLAQGGPMLLDVRVSRNVLNITYRRMCYGEDV